MMSVSFTNGGAFTNGFYSNCQGLLLYLPFFKQTPCDSGTYSIEFWDGFYNAAYINPLQTHAFLLGGAQTYTVEDTTMTVVQGSLTFPLLTISLAQNGNNLESTVTGGFPPYTYQWGNGDTSINTSLTQIGNYTLIVIDARGCIDTATFYFNSIEPLGADNSNSIKIHPNPFTRSATLEFDGVTNGTYSVKLYGITGNLLREELINTTRTTIDKGSLSSGMYFISVNTSKGTLKSRFVIQ